MRKHFYKNRISVQKRCEYEHDVIATEDVIENVYFLREVENSAKAVVASESFQISLVGSVCIRLESIE